VWEVKLRRDIVAAEEVTLFVHATTPEEAVAQAKADREAGKCFGPRVVDRRPFSDWTGAATPATDE
jgi:hypothetical protein